MTTATQITVPFSKTIQFISTVGEEIDTVPIKEISLSLSMIPDLHTYVTEHSASISNGKLISMCTKIEPFYKETFLPNSMQKESGKLSTLSQINSKIVKFTTFNNTDAKNLVLRVFIFSGQALQTIKNPPKKPRPLQRSKSLESKSSPTTFRQKKVSRTNSPYAVIPQKKFMRIKSIIEEKLFVLPDLTHFDKVKIILKRSEHSAQSVSADIYYHKFSQHLRSIFLIHENESSEIGIKKEEGGVMSTEEKEGRDFKIHRFLTSLPAS